MVPTRELVDLKIVKLVARGANGAFCLLPRHADFVTALVPGIVVITYANGAEGADRIERFIATDEGLLIKCAAEVFVSVAHAVVGDDIDLLRETLDARLGALDDEARRARSALARLEASTLRGFLDLETARHV